MQLHVKRNNPSNHIALMGVIYYSPLPFGAAGGMPGYRAGAVDKADTLAPESHYHCSQDWALSSFHRAIGQIPRFDAATKSQNTIVSGAQTRFPASSSAWLEFSPLR